MTTWSFQRGGYAVFHFSDLHAGLTKGQVRRDSPDCQLDATLSHTRSILRDQCCALQDGTFWAFPALHVGWVARDSKVAQRRLHKLKLAWIQGAP